MRNSAKSHVVPRQLRPAWPDVIAGALPVLRLALYKLALRVPVLNWTVLNRTVPKLQAIGILQVVVACVAAMSPGGAAAEGGSLGSTSGLSLADESPDYRRAVETALSELELGNFAEAYAQFDRAHRLSPSARTLRGLGVVSFEMRRYVEAERHLTAALASVERPLEDELRKRTAAVLSQARRYIGTVELRLSPPDARVWVDQAPLETGPGSISLNLGDHLIEVRADGFRSEQRRVRVRGEEVQTLVIELAPINLRIAPQPPPGAPTTLRGDAPAADSGDSVFASPWLWTGVGVVLAGAVVGTVLALSPASESPPVPYGGSTGTTLPGP